MGFVLESLILALILYCLLIKVSERDDRSDLPIPLLIFFASLSSQEKTKRIYVFVELEGRPIDLWIVLRFYEEERMILLEYLLFFLVQEYLLFKTTEKERQKSRFLRRKKLSVPFPDLIDLGCGI